MILVSVPSSVGRTGRTFQLILVRRFEGDECSGGGIIATGVGKVHAQRAVFMVDAVGC